MIILTIIEFVINIGNTLANLKKLQELQLLQLGQCEIPRRETELSLFSIPFGSRDNQSQETLRNLLDTHCIIDGITREAARWPTECEVCEYLFNHKDGSMTLNIKTERNLKSGLFICEISIKNKF